MRLSRFGIPLLCALYLYRSTADAAEAAPKTITADEAISPHLTLEELLTMVVTASKRSQSLATAPAVITVITEEDIRAYGSKTLIEVLEQAVSVMGWGSAGFPRSSLSIRGDRHNSAQRNVLMLLNGRPFRDSEVGVDAPLLVALPLSAVARIEVIRGPGSVLFGTNAYSGVINVLLRNSTQTSGLAGAATSQGPDRPALSVHYGSFGSVQADASAGAKVGDLQVFGAARVEDSKGWNFDYTDYKRVQQAEDFGDNQLGFVGSVRFRGFSLDATYLNADQDYLGISPLWPAEAPARTRARGD
jgi:outer membrane receptor for ferrienterochelin and colicins